MAQDKILEIGVSGKNMNWIDETRTKLANRLRIRNQLIREILAEIIGTAFLVMMGETGVAIQVLSRNIKGDPVTENLAWGAGVFFAILMTADISGAHFNPAVTTTWALLGRIPWKKVIPYILAQILGGFIGSGIVFLTYYDAINDFDGGIRQIDGPNGTAGIFSTYPIECLSTKGAIWDQVMGTCSLILAVLAVSDPRVALPKFAVPFAVGIYVTVNGFVFSYNAGGGINPARDFGPRLMTWAAGYGDQVFSYRNYNWFWIPLFCPFLGGIMAAVIYNLMVGIHYPPTDDQNNITQNQCQEHANGAHLNCSTSFAKLLMEDPNLRRIYLTQQSLEFLDTIGKRDSTVPLVR